MATILKYAGKIKILAIMTGLDSETPLQLIELAGRTAYQSRSKITPESAEKFAEMIRKRGHEAVLEHSCMTVEFNDVSRGFTHELVRHRLMAITQESTRYVDESEFRVVVPPEHDEKEKIVQITLPSGHSECISLEEWFNMNEQMYRGLRKAGWAPQDARQVLPIAIKSQIVITANFREWRHIFKMRCALDAHWEIRLIMVDLLFRVQQLIPVIFDDFEIADFRISAAIKTPD
jgi:thymidylate synthase (FAD)